MGKVLLDNLEVGMVLAGDVQDRNGRMLLGAGAELTAKHLVIFRTWGVEAAEIDGIADGDGCEQAFPSEVTAEMLAEAEAELSPLFATANLDHPAMAELFRLATLRRAMHGSV